MGLLNVYKFSNTILPHISNRFKVSFYSNDANAEPYSEVYTTYNVKSVELPVFNIDCDETRQRFGNTQFVIPILNYSKTELSITFTETDNMDVTSFMLNLFGTLEYYNIFNAPLLKIKIEEFSYDMRNTIASHIYVCRPLKIDMPAFAYSSRSDIMEVTTKFYVEYELNTLNEVIEQNSLNIEKLMPDNTKNENNISDNSIATNKTLTVESNKEIGLNDKTVTPETPNNEQLSQIGPAIAQPERRLMSDAEIKDIQNRIKNAGKSGTIELSAKDYLDYKYTLEHKIKEEIESDIAKNGANSKYTKHIGVNGAVYYTVNSYTYTYKDKKTGEIKTTVQNFNRKDNDSTKLDDLMIHTTGGIFNSTIDVLDSLRTGGESMVLFSDFALVKEESLYNGRGHAATSSTDNIEKAVATNTFGVERNSGSGAFADGTIHFVGTNIKISGGDSGNWQEELQKEGINVARTNASGQNNKQYGLGLTTTETSILAAVLYDANKNNSGAFDFKNAKVYMPESREAVKNNKLTKDKMIGTVVTSHDAVTFSSGKHGESATGNLTEMINGVNEQFDIMEKIEKEQAEKEKQYNYSAYP